MTLLINFDSNFLKFIINNILNIFLLCAYICEIKRMSRWKSNWKKKVCREKTCKYNN